ncbi:MAG TPA: TetR/AcrR family transcriptional regulator [Mycobacterium sp.]|nr:TetR/AcrR family transcriptional regulator [Mycobacterium sp.]HTX97475.1 TetR/AcrR family transcriptional regulator [Mycobacterium sp.]
MGERRYGAELEAAIESAVLKLLVDQGPRAVTMEAVAAKAKTSKPVLYRRWPDRKALMRDILLRTAIAGIQHEDTGSYRSDMLAVLRGWADICNGHGAAVLRAVVAAMAFDADLAEAFRTGVIAWRKQQMAALIARGIQRGDVRPDVSVEIARELAQSVLWHRLLITDDPITDDLVVHLVDDVLVPYASPRRK